MKTVCVYHSIDLDGWMSAAIVKYWFEKQLIITNSSIDSITDKIDFIGYNYGQPIPDLSEYDKVIMCDISFEPNIMKGLIDKLSNNFIWIDHHISAIKSCPQTLPYATSVDDVQPVSGLRDTNFAACELTWKYFFPNEEMPEIVRLLGLYDSFRHKGTYEETKVLEFQYGARQCISNYKEAYKNLIYNLKEKDFYEILDVDYKESIYKKGKSIYQYLCTEAKQAYENGFPITLKCSSASIYQPGGQSVCSHKWKFDFLCINKERFNPINFGIDYHKDGYDGVVCFHFDGTHWNFSLYNDNGLVDCSQIAKQFGGGGHKGASGFRLPFKDNNIDSFLRPRM